MRIAVIGAGMAGLVTARGLAGPHQVTVFEKSRGLGGRMATRRADRHAFDHGAQFFTARSAAFRDLLRPAITAGVVRPWHARFVELDHTGVRQSRAWDDAAPHYVACPRMSALAHWLAGELDIRLGATVTTLRGRGDGWWLERAGSGPAGPFDWVITATPAPQAAELLPPRSAIRESAGAVTMQACQTLMLGFDRPLDPGFDAAVVTGADLSWIGVNGSKPGRAGHPSLVVHSTNRWADAWIERDPADVRRHLLAELARLTDIDPGKAARIDLHRWRYANAGRRAGARALVDAGRRLAACGDWCIRGRVESAFLSARALLEELARCGVSTHAEGC